eukprot:2203529-Ditylum_brightwellii.AAC.1
MMAALEQLTGKSIICGKELMTSMLRRLTTTVGFGKNDVLSDSKRARNKMMDIMINSATKCVQSLHPDCKSTIQLLTGIAALFLPQNSSDQSISHHSCCDLLRINQNSKYVKMGLENCAKYDEFVSCKEKEIVVHEMVSCHYGYVKLIEKINDYIKIKLVPWNYEVTYKPTARAQISRYEPPLDAYECKLCIDTTPTEWIIAIQQFHRKHNAISPNKKDIAT